MLGSIGIQELLIIAAVVLLIFGPKRLPQLGRTFGETVRALRGLHSDDNEE